MSAQGRRVLVLGTAALAAFLGACSKGEKRETVQAASGPPAPLAVQVASAEVRPVTRTISVTGELLPDETVSVSSEVAGRITRLTVDFGQSVRKGQVIAELDRQELNLAVDRTKASLAQALARVGLEPGQEDQRPTTSPTIRQAQAQLEDLRFKYESAAALVKTGDISQERFNEVEKAYRARQASVEGAQDELRTQLASIQALRAEVRLAQKRANDATVVAPFDGSVSQRQVSVGQYIKENTPIVTLVKSWPLRLRLEVPESGTAAVRVGTALSFTTDAAPGATFQAVVRQLNPSLDAKSRSLTAEARIPNADPRLRPGVFVQVQLAMQRDAQAVFVPKRAVYTVAGLSKVYVLRDGKASEVRVPPGLEMDGAVEVPAGQIKPGEPVAVSNLGQLYQGAAVRPKS